MNDVTRKPSDDPVHAAVVLAARRIAEFVVMVVVSILVFQRGPFWQWPWFFRLVTAIVVAAAVFLIYMAVLGARRPRSVSVDGESPVEEHLASRTFRVPQNFGMQTIVLAMLAFAILTAMLRSLQVPPVESLVVVGIVSLVSAMQIFMNRVPRMASAIMGAGFGAFLGMMYCLGVIKLPRFVLEFRYQFPSSLDQSMVFSLIAGCVLGGVVGYVIGALVAGLFLFTEVLVEWWTAEAMGKSGNSTLR